MRPSRAFATLLLVCAGSVQSASITVDTATDDFGTVATNCSLREAVQSANSDADFGGCTHTGIYGPAITDVIRLPTLGVGAAFNLTRVGTDDTNVAGDLDITGLVRIDGVSQANSIIRGDTTDPDSQRHRLVQVISGTTTLQDLTLRDGLEDNGVAGGGLRSEPGSTTVLTRVTVTANEADGNAGGILNRGTMTINDSTISNNVALAPDGGGGGIFNSPDASLTLNDSIVRDNQARGDEDARGGGIYSAEGATLVVDNSVVHGNRAEGTTVLVLSLASGGGIYASGSVTLVQCSITGNEASAISSDGGGVMIVGATAAVIDRCVISGNVADMPPLGVGGDGGGVRASAAFGSPKVRVVDSVISGNHADDYGGGLAGELRIERSTIANNSADERGGGVYLSARSELVDSTILDNEAKSGGGIFVSTGNVVSLVRSSTIAGNRATGGVGEGIGGGILVQGGSIDLANTVLAANTASNDDDECAVDPSAAGSAILSSGFNLIQASGECPLISQPSDQIGINAGLAPATNNGGPVAGSSLGTISGMLTRAPNPSSPLLDRGDTNGCRDVNGATLLTTDQLGNPRAIDGPDPDTDARCDIGAVERLDVIFRNGFDP